MWWNIGFGMSEQFWIYIIILLNSPATSSVSLCRRGRECGSSPWRWGRWCWPPCPGWSPPQPRCNHWGWRCPWCWPPPALPPAHPATAAELASLKQNTRFVRGQDSRGILNWQQNAVRAGIMKERIKIHRKNWLGYLLLHSTAIRRKNCFWKLYS